MVELKLDLPVDISLASDADRYSVSIPVDARIGSTLDGRVYIDTSSANELDDIPIETTSLPDPISQQGTDPELFARFLDPIDATRLSMTTG